MVFVLILATSLVAGVLSGSGFNTPGLDSASARLLDWAGGAAGVGAALAVFGFLLLRAAISRRGSLYRST